MKFYLLLILLAVAGAALVVAGIAMWSTPAAVVAAGVMLVASSVLGLTSREPDSGGEVDR